MSVSRTKRTAENAIMGFVYQFITMILGFVSRVVFLRTIGVEFLGLNGIFSDVLNLLCLADLGFSTAMSYSFYKPLADGDEERITALVAFYRKLYNIVALIVLVCGLCCIPFLKVIVNVQNDIRYLEIYYLFALANVVTSYLFVYKTTLLTADQKDYMVIRIRMVINITKVLLQILILIVLKSYMLYLAADTLMVIVSNIIATRKAEKEYPYIRNLKDKSVEDVSLKEKIVVNMRSVFIYKVSTTVFSATDNIIISMVVSTVAVGMFGNYLMLSQKLLLMEQILFSSMTASIGNVIAKENDKKRYEVFKSIQSISLILCGVITGCYFLLADDFVRLIFGQEYTLSTMVVCAVTVNAYFSCALQPLWLYRDATGLYRKTKYIMLIATIENIVLSVVLGHVLGIAGVIFASAIARLTTYCWYEPKILFKEYFNESALIYYRDIAVNIILCIFAIAALSLVTSWIQVTGILMLIIKGGIVACLSFAFFIGVYFNSDGAQNIIAKIKMMIRR